MNRVQELVSAECPESKYLKELVWCRFRSVFGSHLRMGVQTILSARDWVNDPNYRKFGLIERRGSVQRVSHPSAVRVKDIRENGEMKLLFAPRIGLNGNRSRLVLSRRGNKFWTVAARFPSSKHSERKVFGFSAKEGSRYNVPLALPGEVIGADGQPIFVPVYIKLVNWVTRKRFYIQVRAEIVSEKDDLENPDFFTVYVCLVEENIVPPILKRAMPLRRAELKRREERWVG